MGSTAASAVGTEIRSFEVDVARADLDELRRRIEATRWPEKETVTNATQGVQLATIQALAHRNLIYFNEVDRGNHVAAWQEPELFTKELRAAFRSLR
jgi:hypothetical protein